MIACMGGWCRERNGCAHYLSQDARDPVERLCEPGKDEPESPRIQRLMPVGSWQLKHAHLMARAEPMGVL